MHAIIIHLSRIDSTIWQIATGAIHVGRALHASSEMRFDSFRPSPSLWGSDRKLAPCVSFDQGLGCPAMWRRGIVGNSDAVASS